jgi:hypothetical protein
MRIGRWIVVAGLTLGLTTLAAADEPRKPGATGVFVPGASHDLSLAVLSNKRLQDELKITAAQGEKLTPLAETFDAAQKAWRADRRNDRAAAATAHQAAQAESKKGVEAILTAEQARRLTQIERQVAGISAFLDETNAKELGLTDAQRGTVKEAHLKRLRDGADARRGAILGIGDPKVLRQLDEAAAATVNAALTDEQKKKWEELLGEPFDTTGFLFQPIIGSRR